MKRQTIIKQFIRNPKNNQPRGIVVAVRNNDEVRYGYSLLNTKLDRFDKKIGLNIAINRALSDGYNLPNTLEREVLVVESLVRVQNIALKYFKDLDPDKVQLTVNLEDRQYTEL